MLALPLALLLATAQAQDDSGTPLELTARDRSVSVFVGSGQGTAGDATFTAGELGGQWHGAGRKLRSEVAATLTYVQQDEVTIPVLVAEVGPRYTPWPDWRARPFVGANLGAAFLVVLPFPTLNLQLGAEINVGKRLTLEPALVARHVFNPYGRNAEPVTVSTFRLGVGF